MTLTIDDALFARLQASAARRSQTVDIYATTVLTEAVALDDPDDAELALGERASIREGVRRGLDDFASDRFHPFADHIRDAIARYELRD